MGVHGLFGVANMALTLWQAITSDSDAIQPGRIPQGDRGRNTAGGEGQEVAKMAHFHRLNAKGAETPWSSSLRTVT